MKDKQNGVCSTCGSPMDGTPGDYYHEKDCEARMIRSAMAGTDDQLELRRLQAALDRAE